MTVALHLYKGMVVGIAIQTIMGPLNLIENPLVYAIIFGNGLRLEDKIFNEKSRDELDPNEIVDESGEAVGGSRQLGAGKAVKTSRFEDLLLDTWDAGNKADIGTLMTEINEKNCNFRTEESGWTPLMILSGLHVKGASSAIKQLKELGGNPAQVDKDKWNALHWAAFHGSVDAAKELVKDTSLLSAKDKEGKVPLDLAKEEGNDKVAKFLETLNTTSVETSSEGLRKRK